MQAERRFRAMGTDVHVIVHGDPDLAALAEAEVLRLERRWSRFLDDSEVSELNRRAGEWVDVSPDTILLVERAILAANATDGRFDPTVLGDVLRAGYDRSFEQVLAADPDREVRTATLGRGVDHLDVDAAAGRVRLAAGTGFDPGGIGKGLAADLAAARVDAEGAAGVLVNIGGDLRAVGIGPDGDDWTVALDPAASGHPFATVVLDHGALATSTVRRRRWELGGAAQHHLIDPATGRPSTSEVASASVLAAHGWQAEALAKAALLAGLDEGLALIERLGADGVLIDHDGTLHATARFDRFLVPAPSLLEGALS
ncbi:MAG: FAD:protein FMN transferase [Acidimicrobiales bacterium]